ncbi:hypothetical protein [Leptospira noguchii]|uniref:Uncharacterized protein n=1 Tax=Leptospira noguchii TaxID=28182 RepID=A0AAE9GHH3_9LEPT|nr:hypothetical protein [Leptospira noguchii]UOG29843.1 hypothetical protein MAL06_14530 [Leptospira noguchii]UOG33604.1 hypothetical protein MAL02_13460 [Leptospira noguchii]UOG40921.1 hypothetical protein MAL05_13835 [Leptospira noguchii]UOG44446.1 hypothetical protein MAL01_13725 [Leptospira noguchii]UOG55975.1 hypothetical protein MAL03_14075 [Leptospira noguchii]
MRFLKFGAILFPLLFTANCVKYRVGSGAFAGDRLYLIVHKDTGNPYDPNRLSSQLVLCNIDANDSLDCKPAVIKGLR